ncbi:MAG: hypothetical protein V1691_00340 [Chloroflexota bacterium]
MPEVITVSGPVSPDKLGITLSHVHVLCELVVAEQRPSMELMTASEREIYTRPLTMDLLGTVRRNAFAVKDNLIIGSLDDAINELMYYKRMGGSSLIEATPVGIGRDPVGLKKVAGATGLNIICNTGAYIGASHPAYIREGSVAELAEQMVRELTVEIGNTGVRAGVIKAALSGTTEVPFTPSEEKVLRAGARAQAETGAAMTLHPCHNYGRAHHHHTYMDIMKEEGANLEKFYFSHLEFWAKDLDYQKSILERGVYVAFDQCGCEEYVRPAWPKPNDQDRVQGIVNLVKAGYASRILLSNEVVRKSGLRKYGGYGYAHVLENIVPDLRYFGVTQEQINTMLVENPKKLFPF